VSNNAALSGYNDFAVALWVNRAANPPVDENSYIAATWDTIGNQRSWAAVRGTAAAGYAFRLITSTDGAASVQVSTIASASVFDGAWHHVVVTRAGTNVVTYLDAAPVDSVALSGTLKASASLTTLGAIGAGGNRFYGAVDDVLIFNRALTAAEVSRLYQWRAP